MCSRNYLAHAGVLAESFLAHHPDGRFSLLLVDRDLDGLPAAARLDAIESLRLLLPSDVGVDASEFERRATMYPAQGMPASFKPDLLRALLAEEDGPVVLVDADGCIYADLAPIAELAARHAVVLSPHSLDPYPLHGLDAASPRWHRDSPDQIIMRAGVMNGGLLAVGPGGEKFLAWWSERTRRRCVFDEPYGLMLCQPWLTAAVALFDSAVLRDRGCNVAGWNLQARDVRWDGDRPTIDGGALRHFHFAGSFDPEHPDTLTPVARLADWWTPLADRPGVARLVGDYAERLLARGFRDVRSLPGPSLSAPDGTPIEPWMREVYRHELMESDRLGAEEPPNPFRDGFDRFAQWLSEHAESAIAQSDTAPTAHEPELGRDRPELRAALLEANRLLERIGELERLRDDTVEWAEDVSARLRESEVATVRSQAQAEHLEAELRQTRATMDSVLGSASWRVTKPLRGLKSPFRRDVPGSSA